MVEAGRLELQACDAEASAIWAIDVSFSCHPPPTPTLAPAPAPAPAPVLVILLLHLWFVLLRVRPDILRNRIIL